MENAPTTIDYIGLAVSSYFGTFAVYVAIPVLIISAVILITSGTVSRKITALLLTGLLATAATFYYLFV